MKLAELSKRDQFLLKDQKQLGEGSMVCNQKYLLSKCLGRGAFGKVYLGRNMDNKLNMKIDDQKVAIKVEITDENINQIFNEIDVLKELEAIHPRSHYLLGIPTLYYYGTETANAYMIMELLGPSLHDLLNLCGQFSLKTTLCLVQQIIKIVEGLHEKGFIYRDIKPENILMGIRQQSSKVHFIDFGLCKRYRDIKTGLLYPFKENSPMAGTIRYMSLNSHLGIEQSRRDDLESICYLMIYMLKLKLPWQGINGKAWDKSKAIMEIKLKTTPAELCQGLPQQIGSMLQYCRSLDFYEQPNYQYIYSLIENCAMDNKLNLDNNYDWMQLKDRKENQNKYINLEVLPKGYEAPISKSKSIKVKTKPDSFQSQRLNIQSQQLPEAKSENQQQIQSNTSSLI